MISLRKRKNVVTLRNVKPEQELPLQSWYYMYRYPPSGNLTLEEFEIYAHNRVKLLQSISNARERGLKGNEFSLKVRESCEKFLGKQGSEGEVSIAGMNRDEAFHMIDSTSHHILRLAYSKNENLRRWLVQNETTLFRWRLENESSPETYSQILRLNDLQDIEVVSDDERRHFEKELKQVEFLNNPTVGMNNISISDKHFYKVDFTQVLSLVSTRKVFLHRGKAFVSQQNLIALLVQLFRSRLSEALARIHHVFPSLQQQESDRIVPFLNIVASNELIAKENANKYVDIDEVTPESIDTLATQSFPLCMRNLHTALRKKHHLKHMGRMQYGLFLKGIGLKLEDALRFWQEEFSKSIGVDKFQKEYAYNIRHNYGKEGKRVNYTPYGCMKIIMDNAPSEGDDHGCPFRHYDENNLRLNLTSTFPQITSTQVAEIVTLANQHRFDIACQRYFELTHPGIDQQLADSAKNHPNAYFKSSMAYHRSIKEQGQSQPSQSVKREATFSAKSNPVMRSNTKPTAASSSLDTEMPDLNDEELEALDRMEEEAIAKRTQS